MAQSHGNTAAQKPIHAPQSRSFSGPFGRMFRELPFWEAKGNTEKERIDDIVAIAEDLKAPDGAPLPNNPKIPAGYTYFGQFVDHDLTFDPRSSLQKHVDPDNLEDFRSPSFDLDCVYGRGPDDQPYMYEPDGKALLTGSNPAGDDDLPRNTRGRALIGDKRNDENTFVGQLQLIFLKFHNRVLGDKNLAAGNFVTAQRIVRWHYQWVVIHDWLKRLCGDAPFGEGKLVDSLLNSNCPGKPDLCFYEYKQYPFMPLEFSVAAYRLGHSMVRGRYSINNKVQGLDTFSFEGDTNPFKDFRGFRPLPGGWTIDWSRFFDFSEMKPTLPKGIELKPTQASLKIDGQLVDPLRRMPDAIANPSDAPGEIPTPTDKNSPARSLAVRNLVRSHRLGLPSGESVARRMGLKPIDFDTGRDTPLWVYILKEAEKEDGGVRLGKVGARIVAETFVGLLAADRASYYSVAPNWTPAAEKTPIPVLGNGFQLRDIVAYAGGKIGEPPEAAAPPPPPPKPTK
jgi:hypothetical protein